MDKEVRACAVDAIVIKPPGMLLLVKRKFEPYKGCWVLPGGFVDHNETVLDAVVREVKEETGIEVEVISLAGVYSDPARDPRQNISIAYRCYPTGGTLADSDETEAAWYPFKGEELPELGFDHGKILEDYMKRF